MRGKTIIIQGGQYGSEGKGQVAAEIAKLERVTHAVRTGSINAGHTVYYKGKKFSMQIIPTAWIHPGIVLVLGAGIYIEPDILYREIAMIEEATGENIRERLIIDYRAVWFGDAERIRSQEANRHHAMGATGKGCSEAIISKMRDRGGESTAHVRLFRNLDSNFEFQDTAHELNVALENGNNVLLEGTQGALLDFNLGPYPFVTTRMTNAAAWLAEAGLPPINVDTVLVLRSHPIRVAGNSGPMPQEISWPTLFREINADLEGRGLPPRISENVLNSFENWLEVVVRGRFPETFEALGAHKSWHFEDWSDEEKQKHRVCLSEANTLALNRLSVTEFDEIKQCFEMTTVTKKLRRLARFDLSEARRAIRMNAPTRIAYTFLNYDYPHLWDETDLRTVGFDPQVREFLDDLEGQLGVPIQFVSTGRLQEHVINLNA